MPGHDTPARTHGQPCSVEGCGKPARQRGWCSMHYYRWRRHRDVEVVLHPVGVPLVERFWRRVNKDGPIPAHRPELGPCWVWTGARDPNGYGGVMLPGRAKDRAHRVSWTLTQGAIPAGLFVLHRCDNTSCCRPEHLFLGTQVDNAADMMAKGRGRFDLAARGEDVGGAKLNEDKVRQMRELADFGLAYTCIAGLFGVHLATARNAILGITWRHVQ